MRRNIFFVLVFFVVAVTVNLGVGYFSGIGKPMESDAFYYLDIAKNLASGKGYALTDGFWVDEPTMTRSPGWPMLISGALRVADSGQNAEDGKEKDEGGNLKPEKERREKAEDGKEKDEGGNLKPEKERREKAEDGRRKTEEQRTEDNVMRVLCLILNALNAALVTLLALRIGADMMQSTIAGVLYLFYPTALYLALGGASEILFLTLTLAGTMLLMTTRERGFSHGQSNNDRCSPNSSGKRHVAALCLWQYLGFFLLGLATLVRANFVIWIGVFGAMLLVMRIAKFSRKTAKLQIKAERPGVRIVLPLFLAFCLFLAPSLLWAYRNYRVCGEFPVLSTLRGQTFYGGNNEIVARLGNLWGYWVFPNEISGETPMRELAESMSELQIDRYYTDKGKDYLKENWSRIPLLVTGKLVRAYLPIPWKLTPGLLVVNGYRFFLYVMIGVGAWHTWRHVRTDYKMLAISFLLVNAVTVMAFWGCARFAFAVEPFFIPFASCFIHRMWRQKS